MGMTSFVIAKLAQARLAADADIRQSNFSGTLAQYIAESGINYVLFAWDTKLTPFGVIPAGLPAFSSLTATYSVGGGPSFYATTTGTYSISITGSNPYNVIADATASTIGAASQWQNVTRRVQVTVASGSVASGSFYVVTGYSR